MRTQIQSGFTIIEVMLFLAITGALAAGVLMGSSATIGQQRYRDSVFSFKGHIQEQYGQIANVINADMQNSVCTRSGESVSFDDQNLLPRGTSDCLIMGRFMLIEATEITSYNLIGQRGPGAVGVNDTEELQTYALALQSPETYEVSWRARIVEPKSSEGSLASVLIVRSPLSGAILTYVQDGDYRLNIKDMVSSEGDAMDQKNFCVDSGGGSAMINRLAVRINAKASNQSAIEIPLEKDDVCD